MAGPVRPFRAVHLRGLFAPFASARGAVKSEASERHLDQYPARGARVGLYRKVIERQRGGDDRGTDVGPNLSSVVTPPSSGLPCPPQKSWSFRARCAPGSYQCGSFARARPPKGACVGGCRRDPVSRSPTIRWPIYDADLAKIGASRQNAIRLQAARRQPWRHLHCEPGVQRRSIAPLLKNADRTGYPRVVPRGRGGRDEGRSSTPSRNRALRAPAAASPGRSGGMQSLITLRQVLGDRLSGVRRAGGRWTIPENARRGLRDATTSSRMPRAAAQLKLVCAQADRLCPHDGGNR